MVVLFSPSSSKRTKGEQRTGDGGKLVAVYICRESRRYYQPFGADDGCPAHLWEHLAQVVDYPIQLS
jgi:hypothetical protein